MGDFILFFYITYWLYSQFQSHVSLSYLYILIQLLIPLCLLCPLPFFFFFLFPPLVASINLDEVHRCYSQTWDDTTSVLLGHFLIDVLISIAHTYSAAPWWKLTISNSSVLSPFSQKVRLQSCEDLAGWGEESDGEADKQYKIKQPTERRSRKNKRKS